MSICLLLVQIYIYICMCIRTYIYMDIYIYRHMRDIQGNHMLERPAVASERGLVMSTLGLRVHYTLNIIRNPPPK